MDFLILFNGIFIGIGVSIPLGPVGILCIQKTMSKGFLAGFFSGFGAVAADVFYAFIAGFGVTLIKKFLHDHQAIIRILGAVVLLIFAAKVFYSNPIKQKEKQKNGSKRYLTDFITTFFIAFSNPVTVLAFGTIFAGFGLLNESSPTINTVFLIVGVMIGAIIWWLILVSLTRYFRKKIKLKDLLIINKITGVLIFIFALSIGISVMFLN